MKAFYIILAVFFVAMVLVEYLFTKKKHPKYYNRKDTIVTFKLGVLGIALDLFVKIVTFYLLHQLTQYAFFNLDYQWWVWLACFFCWDFIFYFMHRAEHEVRILWATHINHHSSKYLNLSTALRPALLKSLYRYFFFAPMVLIGFPFEMFLVIYALGKFWAYFMHSKFLGHFGFLESILVTPSHHRVHHSSNNQNYGKNYGETLIIWDKLFGTFKSENECLEFGIEADIIGESLFKTAFHEFEHLFQDVKQAQGLKNKLGYIFKKPGWKPNCKD